MLCDSRAQALIVSKTLWPAFEGIVGSIPSLRLTIMAGVSADDNFLAASLMTHGAVLEAAVVGVADTDELVKPKAYVVLKQGLQASADDLKAHVKSQLAPYKYPRWIAVCGRAAQDGYGQDSAV
jgi:acyl-CoA synthetase (AMP-forming)/AMP-acid ligase II